MIERVLYHSIDSSIKINNEILRDIFKDRGRYLNIDYTTDENLELDLLDEKIFRNAMLEFLNNLNKDFYEKFFEVKKGFFKRLYYKYFKKIKNNEVNKEYITLNNLNLKKNKNNEEKVFEESIKSRINGKIDEISDENIKKAWKLSGYLKEYKNYFITLLSMLKDYYKGEFDIPKKDIAIIVSAIIYVLTPIDLVPDILPVAGFSDDISVIAISVKKLPETLNRYKNHKNNYRS